YRFREVRAMVVGHDAKCHCSLAMVLQSLIGHNGPEVGPADPDIYNVANALPSVALPRATPDPLTEVGHLVEDSMHIRNDVMIVNNNRCSTGRAQREMEHRPIFRSVNLFTPEHRVNPRSLSGLFR